MATALSTLITRTRRYLEDFPQLDALTASIASNGTTLTVADGTDTYYHLNQRLEIGYEVLRVAGTLGATSVPVRRALEGSTAASYASGTVILVDPAFSSMDIIDGINLGLDELWPYFYTEIVNTTGVVPNSSAYEFTVPNVSVSQAFPIPYVHTVEIKPAGYDEFLEARRWRIVRGATPKIVFDFRLETGATVRMRGYAPIPHLSATTDELDAQLPYNAENLACMYAAGHCLSVGEARRVRQDTGAIDIREQATRPGSSAQAANLWFGRFYRARDQLQMPPLQRHVRHPF